MTIVQMYTEPRDAELLGGFDEAVDAGLLLVGGLGLADGHEALDEGGDFGFVGALSLGEDLVVEGLLVVGVEGEARLIERARANAHRNGIGNAEFHQADLAAPDLSHAPWLQRAYSHLLLDPPRVGARELLPAIAGLAPRRLLYVSCHPGTLARDLGILVHEHGFELLAAGVVDMFAHTAHVESLALLGPPRN